MSDVATTGQRPSTPERAPQALHQPITRATVGRLLAGAAILAAFLIAAGFVVRFGSDALTHADGQISRWFEQHRMDPWDTLTFVGSRMANTETAIAVAAVSIVVLRLWLKRWRESLVLAIALAGEVVIFLTVVMIVQRPRPPVFRLDPAPPTSSFPSGHTAAAVTVYGFLAVVLWRYLANRYVAAIACALLFAVPLAVGLARLYRGAHFLTDVIAGAVLGIVWLTFVIHTLMPKHQHERLVTSAP